MLSLICSNRIDAVLDLLDGLHQRGQAFERVVLALHGNHHGIRRHECVQGQHIQRRWAVDENHVEILAHRRNGIAQFELAPNRHGEQANLGGGEILIRRHQHEAAILDGHQCLNGTAVSQQDIAAGAGLRMFVDAASHGGIALRIQVDEQDAALGRGQRRSQIHGGRGFAHTAFLVGHRNDPFHFLANFMTCSIFGFAPAPPDAARRSGPAHSSDAPLMRGTI